MAKLPEDPALLIDAIAAYAKRANRKDVLGLLDRAIAEYEYVDQDWGIDIYRLMLTVPFDIFTSYEDEADDVERLILSWAEKATRACTDGKIRSVSLVPEFDAPTDWRSGTKEVPVAVSDADRIWKPGRFRLFLSHESAYKIEVKELQQALARRNVDGFVAHADIEPTRAWEREITLALASCHAIAAILTPKFHESVWCMQEVGWGLGKGLLVIPVKAPNDPRGFIGQVQALSGSLQDPITTRNHLVNLLSQNDRTTRQMQEPLLVSLEQCRSAEAGLLIADSLERVQILSPEQASRILHAIARNMTLSERTLKSRLHAIADKFGAKVGAAPAPNADEYDPFADE